MKLSIPSWLAERELSIGRRLRRSRHRGDAGHADLSAGKLTYETSDRVRAVGHGGFGLVLELVRHLDLARHIDEHVRVLKFHRPYHESDHVLNLVFNVFCGGQTLDDIELLRNDEAHLDALGVDAIPDPTTAGDFCRRFAESDIDDLHTAINEVRVKVWKAQTEEFTAQRACIDMDGTLVATTGECKEGMALSYKRVWGYHPLLVSLANTGEPLFIANRPGNVNSNAGAAAYADRAIALVREGGFTSILLRGDTDFSQTKFLDGWDEDGVAFVFGYDARTNLVKKAEELDDDFVELHRRATRAFVDADGTRTRPERHKENFVRKKGYKNIILKSEDITEFDYQPTACKKAYRMVVLRKNLSVEKGEDVLFEDVRYFFYITNDRELSAADVVFQSNDRCNQENLIEQLKNGVRALHAPVNALLSNWAYMTTMALAWSIKAWTALSLPTVDATASELADRKRWLRMEFRTFLNRIIRIPAQIVHSGRQRIWRLLAWREDLPVFFRLLDAL